MPAVSPTAPGLASTPNSSSERLLAFRQPGCAPHRPLRPSPPPGREGLAGAGELPAKWAVGKVFQ